MGHPREDDMEYHNLDNMVFQVEEKWGMNIKAGDNDLMEENAHALKKEIEDVGRNLLIHDTFRSWSWWSW